MGYESLRECIDDLERNGHLLRISQEVDPNLEAAEIHRRVFRAGGPAIFYGRVRGCAFPMVSNLFGTMDRAQFIFRDALGDVRSLVRAKVDPASLIKEAAGALGLPRAALHLLPRMVSRGPVLQQTTRVSELPALKSWPDDGGAFITLPQVYSEDPDKPGVRGSNLGMYRVQLSGGDYARDEVGLHYQLHRGIGVHHAAAIARGEPLKVNIFVGGPPAMNVAAVMPLPEGLPEIAFAGALNRRRIRMIPSAHGIAVHADADFCISGQIIPGETRREGPFGDHLGYYAKAHDFPVLRVESVTHRTGAIWPFTTVGRPPQEDSIFGELIHELTGPLVPTVLPGVRAVHAVDAAGVHPLLLAIGSERYVPYATTRRPMEVLTQANAILGQGQMSLAKYLFIAAHEDNTSLDINDVRAFLQHVLERVDPTCDLHFQTNTTMDTLDYSGTGLNQGSKVVVAGVGPKKRELPPEIRGELRLPDGFTRPQVCIPGVLAIEGRGNSERFCAAFRPGDALSAFPLVVLVDDSDFTSKSLSNFLWVTFTRSNPAIDIHGIEAFTLHKAWGCRGSVVIDARVKPHHAPPLVEDPVVTARVEKLAAPGGPLHGVF